MATAYWVTTLMRLKIAQNLNLCVCILPLYYPVKFHINCNQPILTFMYISYKGNLQEELTTQDITNIQKEKIKNFHYYYSIYNQM